MSDIDKLWQMQKHTSNYLAIKRAIKELTNKNNIKKISSELKELEKELEELKNNIDKNEKLLIKNNLMLKDYDYRLKKVEKSLYEENITDLKQLSFLDKERKDILKEIEEKETEILFTMDETDRLKKQLEEKKKNTNKIRAYYNDAVKEYKSTIEELNKKASQEAREIKKIASTIDEKLYHQFSKLVNTKGSAVVEVIDNRCSGCNMVLPWVLVSKLRENDEIVTCENCQRILYLSRDIRNGNNE